MSAAELGFTKMSAGGNDFIVLDRLAEAGQTAPPMDGAFIKRLCARALSVGADGVILMERPEEGPAVRPPAPRADVRMIHYNADGGRPALCGNGVCCVARLAALRGRGSSGRLLIQTDSGTLEAGVAEGRSWFRLPLGRPVVRQMVLVVAGTGGAPPARIEASHVTAGVPHLIVPHPAAGALDRREVEALGAALRSHADLGPEGANVDFVTPVDRRTLEVRCYERGVEAETISSGTGSIASVLAAFRAGLVERETECRFRAGLASRVRLEEGGGRGEGELTAVLSGDARLIYTATLHAEALLGFTP